MEPQPEEELDREKATGCLHECVREYNRQMRDALKKARDTEELNDYHHKASKGALKQFISKYTFTTVNNDLEPYLENINKEVESAFVSIKNRFELKLRASQRVAKGQLVEFQSVYHAEMEAHLQANAFIYSAKLEAHHNEAKKKIVPVNLNELQRAEFEKQVDAMFEKYQLKNFMNLNCESGSCSDPEAPTIPTIGIKFGRNQSNVAVYWKGKVITIPNMDQGGDLSTPNYITFNTNDGKVQSFGRVARFNVEKSENKKPSTLTTIYDLHRFLGVSKTEDKKLEDDVHKFPFKVIFDRRGIPKIMVGAKLLSPEEITGNFLGYLKSTAEKFLKLGPGKIQQAVITVPGNFTDSQKRCTVSAAKEAGLKTLRVISEPEATTLCYSIMGHYGTSKKRKVLTFDFGSKSLEVAIVEVRGEKVETLVYVRDDFFGGDELDKRMVKYCAMRFQNEERIDLFQERNTNARDNRLRRLKESCENAKRQLSASGCASVTVSVDALESGKDLKVEFSRVMFEELNMDYFRRAIAVVEESLQKGGFGKEEIDDVILAGGCTRIPRVREMLSGFFGGKVLNVAVDPEQVVVQGAAVKAAVINGRLINEERMLQRDLRIFCGVCFLVLGILVHWWLAVRFK